MMGSLQDVAVERRWREFIDDLVPGHRLNNFVGCVPHSIDSRQDGPGRKADARAVDVFDVDSFVFGDFQDLIAESKETETPNCAI